MEREKVGWAAKQVVRSEFIPSFSNNQSFDCDMDCGENGQGRGGVNGREGHL
jgi:hypothetical protein